MNAVEKVVAILLAAVLLFICPIQIVAQKQDVVMQQYVTMETSYFIDSVRNLGYLSRQMYEEYKKKIDIGGTLYNVELTHYHMVYYDDSQAKDLVHRRYQCYYMQDIMDQIYDKDKEGVYTFSQDDYVTVKVRQKHKTIAQRFQEFTLGVDFADGDYVTIYGGLIRDETY